MWFTQDKFGRELLFLKLQRDCFWKDSGWCFYRFLLFLNLFSVWLMNLHREKYSLPVDMEDCFLDWGEGKKNIKPVDKDDFQLLHVKQIEMFLL